jgi:hypothetical protein
VNVLVAPRAVRISSSLTVVLSAGIAVACYAAPGPGMSGGRDKITQDAAGPRRDAIMAT